MNQDINHVIALIEARINMYKKADANDPFYQGAIVALKSLQEELQESVSEDAVN